MRFASEPKSQFVHLLCLPLLSSDGGWILLRRGYRQPQQNRCAKFALNREDGI